MGFQLLASTLVGAEYDGGMVRGGGARIVYYMLKFQATVIRTVLVMIITSLDLDLTEVPARAWKMLGRAAARMSTCRNKSNNGL